MDDAFAVKIGVRASDLDTQGHVNGAVYVEYADHARWECLRAAGVSPEGLLQTGVGPVNLETNVRFLRELRSGDEVTVSCTFVWDEGKTFRVVQDLTNPSRGSCGAGDEREWAARSRPTQARGRAEGALEGAGHATGPPGSLGPVLLIRDRVSGGPSLSTMRHRAAAELIGRDTAVDAVDTAPVACRA